MASKVSAAATKAMAMVGPNQSRKYRGSVLERALRPLDGSNALLNTIGSAL
jgi:hypothetical protein